MLGVPVGNIVSVARSGCNVAVLAFHVFDGPVGYLREWAALDAATQRESVAYAHSRGTVLMLTAVGDAATSPNATNFGSVAAQFAVDNHLDGVDFHLQLGKNCSLYRAAGDAVQWVIDATIAARRVLGRDRLLTHSPRASYFGPVGGGGWAGATGCYSSVYSRTVMLGWPAINWFNVQFNNPGSDCYVSYESLILASNANGACPSFPGTSVTEIISYGVPSAAVVIGKPLEPADGNGYISPAALRAYIKRAGMSIGWAMW